MLFVYLVKKSVDTIERGLYIPFIDEAKDATSSQEATMSVVNLWIMVPCPACEGRGVDPWSERANPICLTCHGEKHLPIEEVAQMAAQERREYQEAQAHIRRDRKITKDASK